MKLILFYDSSCPLCVTEMRQLQTHNNHQQLLFEDILAPDFNQRFPYINITDASTILHGLYFPDHEQYPQLLLGLDVTCLAWKSIGKKKWLALLRWPIIGFFADKCYLFFARNRYKISYLFTGKSRCKNCKID
ncbi:DUF393 domain-containing protein [Photobacterium phosphoreum]|uniref:thiol-disulfide oxidoreductase DCC family protein n=1 Tax=Photobacterium phosphoreum TaxID=659 RepID=UPI000D166955|nr:DUF393 domain-containing protein [Photobacterium phosphoreum]PSU78494.1 DUF393 domain-containing protein [Photobacterium phosphoreum]PSW35635.1 DUF393 domain-containing protein [Photobacterium phosphoreum]